MKLKLYIFISLIIHLSLLIFSVEFDNKERLKGEKIVPIEIINNKSFNYSKGNSNQNSLEKNIKKIINKNNESVKTEKKYSSEEKIKSNYKKELFEGDFNINKKQISKLEKRKTSKTSLDNEKKYDTTKIYNFKKKGFSNKTDKKDLEKGSVKGKGKLKITCLKCVTPKYPKKALKKGLEGKPTIKVWILMNGSVEKAEIIISSGITLIDKAALEAAIKSKFYPIEDKSFINIEYDLKLK